MKKTAKIISLLMVLTLMLAMTAGCVNTGNGDNTSGDTANIDGTPAATTDGSEETAPTPTAVLGERDFNGETVTFYSRYYNGVWISDLMATEDDADTLKVAVYRRNKLIEEEYGVKLAEIQSGSASFRSSLERLVSTGDDSFDAVYMSVTDAAESASAGLFIDLHDVPNIDLEAKWWSQSCNKSWSIGGRQFFAVGDITTTDNMSARGVFFNKKMLNSLQLESPYDSVANNTWTFEKMFEMAQAAYVPSSSGAGEPDVYGITAQTSFGFIMLMSSGELISVNNEEDIPEINIGSERSLAVIDQLMSKTAGNDAVFMGPDADVMKNFRDSRALFMPEVLYHIATLRDSDIDVGVLPSPKYTPDQENYYSFSPGYGITCLGFPQTCTGDRLDKATFIVEAMSIQSLTTVTPAYFEVCIKSRYASDVESSGMIQIVLDTICTDLAEVYKWGDLRNKVQNAISTGQGITSSIKASKKVAEIAIKQTVDAWNKVKAYGG